MNIAIWGVKNSGKILSNLISKDNNIVCFVDNDISQIGKTIGDKEIWGIDKLVKAYDAVVDHVVISARNNDNIVEVINQLQSNGIENIGVADLSFVDYGRTVNPNKTAGGIFWVNETGRPMLWYLEIPLTKACNLKCKGCSHFASIFSNGTEYPLNEFEADLTHTVNNVDIFRLRLLGGEPFLLKDFEGYVRVARKILPNSCIQVVSNGLLIPKLDGSVLEAMKNYKVDLVISVYPPTLKCIPDIISKLEAHGVRYSFSNYSSQNDLAASRIISFSKNLSFVGNNNPFASMKKCMARGCRTLYKGKIYKCSTDAHIADLDSYFALGKFTDGGKDIYLDSLDWEEMIRQFNELPVELCKFCTEKGQSFDWAVKANPELNDWIIES